MSELIAIDQDGVQQFIWLQERGNTCGPACVYMIERIRTKTCPVGGETRIRQITELLPEGYSEKKGTESYSALALALNQINIPATAFFTNNFKSSFPLLRTPFIARIGWPDGSGHFVVCVGVGRKGAVICLDPWYGLAEPLLSSVPAYKFGGVFSGHCISLN